MNIHHRLEDIKMVSIHNAKEHGCNYTVFIHNPDENGEFSLEHGSTYESVIDTYWDKPRPNAKILFRTDDLFAEEEFNAILDQSNDYIYQYGHEINKFIKQIRDTTYHDNIYNDLLPHKKPFGTPVEVRTEPKIQRNESCPCGSGKKYKKCCIK